MDRNEKGQVMAEYVVIVSALLLFLLVFAAPGSPLNLERIIRKYRSGLAENLNQPVP